MGMPKLSSAFESRLTKSIGAFAAALAALVPISLACESARADDIDLATGSPFYVTGVGEYVPTILPGFTQTASANLLTITGEPELTSYLSTHNEFYLPVNGDFTATVNSTVSHLAGGGVFADFNAGYAGIGYASNVVYVNYGSGIGNVMPVLESTPVSDITVRLSRLGANLSLSIRIGAGAFETLYTLTGASVLGPTGFDLTGYGTPGINTTVTTTYSNFNIQTYAPSADSGVTGGTASDPVALPSSTVGSVSGPIGGSGGPRSDYFSFYWEGGQFAATVGVPNAVDLLHPASYEFDLCAGLSCTTIYESVSADPSNDYENELSGDLAAGYYTVGIILEGKAADPDYSVVFGTPVIGGSVSSAVPEPSTWAMLLLAGFGGVCLTGYRRAQRSAMFA
jgi:hypothetical protein